MARPSSRAFAFNPQAMICTRFPHPPGGVPDVRDARIHRRAEIAAPVLPLPRQQSPLRSNRDARRIFLPSAPCQTVTHHLSSRRRLRAARPQGPRRHPTRRLLGRRPHRRQSNRQQTRRPPPLRHPDRLLEPPAPRPRHPLVPCHRLVPCHSDPERSEGEEPPYFARTARKPRDPGHPVPCHPLVPCHSDPERSEGEEPPHFARTAPNSRHPDRSREHPNPHLTSNRRRTTRNSTHPPRRRCHTPQLVPSPHHLFTPSRSSSFVSRIESSPTSVSIADAER